MSADNEGNMSAIAIPTLQLQALEQRRKMHRTLSDLRVKIGGTREKLRVFEQARRHLGAFSATAGLLGLTAGFALGGLFKRD
jgi:hypothetical protein